MVKNNAQRTESKTLPLRIFPKKKNAQMKIQQMAFMLIAITVFFILVGMFVLVIKFAGLKESAELLENENAMLLVTKIANSPEFSCGSAFGNAKLNCIDMDKVMALKGNDAYENFWGVDNIEIRWIYPNNFVTIECKFGVYPDCGIFKLIDEEIQSEYSNFVSLCHKTIDGKDKCEIGRIMIAPRRVE